MNNVVNSNIVINKDNIFTSGSPDTNEFNAHKLELRGYEVVIRESLEKASSFTHFKRLASSEMQRLGYTSWEYRRLDTLLRNGCEDTVGTATEEEVVRYRELSFKNNHLLFEYAKNADKPIYRSAIVDFLNTSPVLTEDIQRYNETEKIYRSLGYFDHVAIPICGGDGKNHAVLILTSKNKVSEIFVNETKNNADMLQTFATIFEEVALARFKAFIVGQKELIDRFKAGRALKLLESMAKNDLAIAPLAELHNMSRTAVDKQLAKIRIQLGATTSYGALYVAIRLGLIEVEAPKIYERFLDNF